MVVPLYPPTPAGGLERQAHLLAKTLLGMGHDVAVVSADGAAWLAPVRDTVEGVHVSRHARSLWYRGTGLRATASIAAWLIRRRSEVDVLHIHNISRLGAWLVTLARALGIPTLLKVPNVNPLGISNTLHLTGGRLWLRALLRADAIVALNPQIRDELAQIGYPTNRVFLVGNGVRVPAAYPTGHHSSRTILFLGRVAREKGLPSLLHAWGALPRAGRSGWRLRIVGDGPFMAETQRLAEQLAVDVEFPGFRTETGEELENGAFLVLPSLAEGNSNSILEAMAHGLPIVASDISGNRFLVGSSGEQFLFPVGDESALASQMLRLMGDPDLRASMGRLMWERAQSAFDIHHVADLYAQAYSLLVRGRGDLVSRIGTVGE